jgi:asparagine synthase (glutamine-hydrolysing)
MAASLETRTPFLDYRVAEFSWRLPLNMKLRDGTGKWLVRQLLYKYVPKRLIERPKAGFSVPIGVWLRGPLRSWAEALLDQNRLKQENILHIEPILKLWEEHLNGEYDHANKLWSILMFQLWNESERK